MIRLILLIVFVGSLAAPHSAYAQFGVHAAAPGISSVSAKLSNAITFKTIATTDEAYGNEFLQLHHYLQQAFPNLHEHLHLEVVNSYSLLYTWKGTAPALAPVLYSAHLDVVPVEEASRDQWEQAPFSGYRDSTSIWGRGTQDDKYRVIAIIEAVEQLLEKGFIPQRTVYLAFGHDEETGGNKGAAGIRQVLVTRGVSLAAVFDEGLAVTQGIFPGIDKPIAFIGAAAKGSINFSLTVNGEGGHSSVPPSETPISILSQAIVHIQNKPFEAQITPLTKETLKILMNELGWKERFAVRHFRLFQKKILKQLAANQATDALIRTKVSPTIIQAGEKDNVLPRQAKAILNVRILTGETEESVRRHLRKAVKDDRVEIEREGSYTPPTQVAETEGESYQALARTVNALFPTALVVPALFPGGTDAKHYADLTDNIFLFAPQLVTPEIAMRVHNVNERISEEALEMSVQFYKMLLHELNQEEQQLVDLRGSKSWK